MMPFMDIPNYASSTNAELALWLRESKVGDHLSHDQYSALCEIASRLAPASPSPAAPPTWGVAPDCISPSQCAAIHAEGGDYVCKNCVAHNDTLTEREQFLLAQAQRQSALIATAREALLALDEVLHGPRIGGLDPTSFPQLIAEVKARLAALPAPSPTPDGEKK